MKMMLTYLDGATSKHCSQCPQRLTIVAVAYARGLAIEIPACLLPGQIVDDSLLSSPEDRGAMRHGQHACVNETFECRGPPVPWPQRCLRPASISMSSRHGNKSLPRTTHQSFFCSASLLRSNTGSPAAVSLSRLSMALVLAVRVQAFAEVATPNSPGFSCSQAG